MRLKAGWVVTLIPVLLWAPARANGQAAPPPPSETLRLRPGDAIVFAVVEEPELGDTIPVADDGAVVLPVVGRVAVAGRAFGDVRREILDGFAREIAGSAVVVVPLLRVAVLGEARQPGLFTVDPTFTVRDVLAAAGGLAPTARRDRLTLVRGGEEVRLSLDGGAVELDRPLLPGDQLVVERRSWVSENLPAIVGGLATVAAAAVTSLILR